MPGGPEEPTEPMWPGWAGDGTGPAESRRPLPPPLPLIGPGGDLVPPSVRVGHAATLAWSVLWVFAGLRGGQAPWGGIIAGTGGLMASLVLVARLRSARAWLLLQLLTVILLCCCVVALSTEPRIADLDAGLEEGVASAEVGEGAGAGAGDENTPLVLVTVVLQAVALVALGQRTARQWHRVDPQGWHTILGV